MKIIHKFNDLLQGKITSRPSKKIKSPYMADVLINKTNELAHSPGLGLCGFITIDSKVLLSKSKNPNRKSKYTIEMVEIINDDNKKVWVGANPVTSNLYFKNIIEKELLSFFPKIINIKQEYKFKKYDSRFDFYLEDENKKYLVEIKNVPLVDYPENKMPTFRKFPIRKTKKRNAIFPDGYQGKKDICVSPRALKHLQELLKIHKKEKDITPVLIFVVQREDCHGFTPNFDKDPVYSNELKKAHNEGLLIKAIMLKLGPKNVKFIKELPIIF